MMSVRQKSNTVGKYETKGEMSWIIIFFFFDSFGKNSEVTPSRS